MFIYLKKQRLVHILRHDAATPIPVLVPANFSFGGIRSAVILPSGVVSGKIMIKNVEFGFGMDAGEIMFMEDLPELLFNFADHVGV